MRARLASFLAEVSIGWKTKGALNSDLAYPITIEFIVSAVDLRMHVGPPEFSQPKLTMNTLVNPLSCNSWLPGR